ncbi:MAG: DUF4256 domain-containing protein [Clostridiales bacterium]|nr:DUF4256 domain-containing protein [Clostridiales bacterium]
MEQITFTTAQAEELLNTLRTRFEAHMTRHPSLRWPVVEAKLRSNPTKLWSVYLMERTGGEPDVFGQNAEAGEIVFFDFSAETPEGRRALCYDRAALDARKANKPESSVLDMAADMGVSLLNEEQYRALQTAGEFDLKTSSWVLTPPEIRSRGGALFCDRRYDHVFTYHNGADSYYSARGFRAALQL